MTKESYKKLFNEEKNDFVTFKEKIILEYYDGYDKYNVIIEEINVIDLTFKAVKENDLNYRFESLHLYKICDKNFISAFASIYPQWV